MREVFWISVLLIGYAYVGYPALLLALARLRPRPVMKQAITPSVSVIMAARNEASRLPRKLENIRESNYPPHLLQVIVASDGSSDETEAILHAQGDLVTPVILERGGGKALAVSAAAQRATGEILVFLDVRQTVDPQAIRELVANFSDPEIGAVSGELLLRDVAGGPSQDAVGFYWKIEKLVRKLESVSGSVVGVTGALYAIRRELFEDLPAGLLLDDVLVPMRIAKAGRRIVFEPKALATDAVFSERGKEFGRKVRTLTGNYQLVKLAPWILSTKDPLLFRFVSHKLLRLLVPLFLVGCLASSLWIGGPFYGSLFLVQAVLYAMAGLGSALPGSRRFKAVAVATTFVTLNAAATVALYNFLVGKDEVWA